MATMTPRQMLEAHPEWADLPMVIYCPDGHYDYVGAAGDVYEAEDHAEGLKVLVFSPN